MKTEEAKQAADNAVKFLGRVDLKGDEVAAYIQVNQLLGGIATGQLTVQAVAPAKQPTKPKAKRTSK